MANRFCFDASHVYIVFIMWGYAKFHLLKLNALAATLWYLVDSTFPIFDGSKLMFLFLQVGLFLSFCILFSFIYSNRLLGFYCLFFVVLASNVLEYQKYLFNFGCVDCFSKCQTSQFHTVWNDRSAYEYSDYRFLSHFCRKREIRLTDKLTHDINKFVKSYCESFTVIELD